MKKISIHLTVLFLVIFNAYIFASANGFDVNQRQVLRNCTLVHENGGVSVYIGLLKLSTFLNGNNIAPYMGSLKREKVCIVDFPAAKAVFDKVYFRDTADKVYEQLRVELNR